MSAVAACCLTKRWHHHSASSGYDRLADQLGARVFARQPIHGVAWRVGRKLYHHLASYDGAALDYRYGDWIAEWRALLATRTKKVDVCHALYGEEQLAVLLAKRSWLAAKLLATFHLPPARLGVLSARWRQNIHRVDAALCVARCQVDSYRQLLGHSRVTFVPHGVDTQVFRPAAQPRLAGPLRLLVLGSHMRDFALLQSVTRLCHRERIDVQFDVICPPRHCEGLVANDLVRIRHNVPEGELIAACQAVDALFLPLTDCTANNALLEGLACGTPAIVSDLPGIRDYAGADCAAFIDSFSAEHAYETIRELAADPTPLFGLRIAARDAAEQFSWQRVAAFVQRCHDAVARDLELPTWPTESR